jgi:hypothetical protein
MVAGLVEGFYFGRPASSGLFIDLDAHPWEVAHNPGWRLADDGSIHLH